MSQDATNILNQRESVFNNTLNALRILSRRVEEQL